MIKKWFWTGLMVIVPIVVTVFVLHQLFLVFDSILGVAINKLVFAKYLGFRIPGVGIILLLLSILLIGAFASFVTSKVARGFESFFLKLPFVDKIYLPVKKIAGFLFTKEKFAFKKVVLVEYPRNGIYSIGFITNESDSLISEKAGKKLINVFVSSSPSPLTGFTVFVPQDELIELPISVEEAMQIVVSGGMLNP